MAKTVLKLDENEQFDFLLFGIVCQQKDYRLCRELNIKLDVELDRQEDYTVFNNKRMEDQGFSCFRYTSPDEDDYLLVANKGTKGLLVPEQKQMDYFLMVRPGMTKTDVTSIGTALKEIRMVLGVYPLEIKKLKSREYLVF